MADHARHFHGVRDQISAVVRSGAALIAIGASVAVAVVLLALQAINTQRDAAERIRTDYAETLVELHDLDIAVADIRLAEQNVVLSGGVNGTATRSLESWRSSTERALALVSDVSERDVAAGSLLTALRDERSALLAYAEGATPILEALATDPDIDPDRAVLALVPVRPFVRDVEVAVAATRAEIDVLGDQAEDHAESQAARARWTLLAGGLVLVGIMLGGSSAMFRRTKRSATVLGRMSGTDPLTGLYNRSGLATAFREAPPSDRRHLAAIFLDVDHFGLVNEVVTTAGGDELLLAVADELIVAAPPDALIARVGGDEFAIVATFDTPDDAEEAAAGFARGVRTLTFESDGHVFPLTASIGVAVQTGSEASTNLDALLVASERAHVAAEELGRDRAVMAPSPELATENRVRLLRQAGRVRRYLVDEHLRLSRQAVVALDDDESRIALSIAALDARSGAVVGAQEILPAATSFGLLDDIDRWSFVSAILLVDAGYLGDSAASIPIAAATLAAPDFPDFARGVLEEHSDAASRLTVEIDHVAFARTTAADVFADVLAPAGVSLMLSGFSAHSANFDLLGIEGLAAIRLAPALSTGLPASAPTIEAFCAVADRHHVATIVSNVPSPDVMATLRNLGVGFAQGPGVSAPELVDAGELWRLANARTGVLRPRS